MRKKIACVRRDKCDGIFETNDRYRNELEIAEHKLGEVCVQGGMYCADDVGNIPVFNMA